MIQILSNILPTDICKISNNNKIVIMSSDSIYPEDYVELDYSQETIKINEVHRGNEKTVLEIEVADRAYLMAGVLALRLFYPIKRDELVEKLRSLVKEGLLEDAHILLNNSFSLDCYSIGMECYDKISMIEASGIADIKYHSEYLVQGASLPRAYAALYNYCKKRTFIEEWCTENIALVKRFGDIREIVELYLLGYIK